MVTACVAPHTGAWIETWLCCHLTYLIIVAPHTGAWIETNKLRIRHDSIRSPPIRGRGLKHPMYGQGFPPDVVAPHTGAWIETIYPWHLHRSCFVAPHTGAWIETGLRDNPQSLHYVAPHTGAWIETDTKQLNNDLQQGRPPYGGVD